MNSLDTEEAIEYFDKKYSNRFTLDDPDFADTLDQEELVPPIVLNYNGKRQVHARRNNYNQNRKNDDFNHGRQYNQR